MTDYAELRHKIEALEKRVAKLEACKHESTYAKYSTEGWYRVCRKCDEEVSYRPHPKPNFNNYEIG